MTRVYVGSFWDQPLRNAANRELFEAEQQDLFNDLQVQIFETLTLFDANNFGEPFYVTLYFM